jgi:hypothetical protein
MVAVAQTFYVVFATLREACELLRQTVFPAGGACFVDDSYELIEVVGVRGSVEELCDMDTFSWCRLVAYGGGGPVECCAKSCPSFLLEAEETILLLLPDDEGEGACRVS